LANRKTGIETGLSPGEYRRRYYQKFREEAQENQNEYRRRFRKNEYDHYVGVVTCPKCGKRGYAEVRRNVNVKTGHVRCKWLQVLHHYTEYPSRKTVYTGHCYIGVVKGGDLFGS
jgi:hypothetical protein